MSEGWEEAQVEAQEADRAEQIEASGGNLEEAAALYDEIVEHYTIAVGPGHKAVKGVKAKAADLRRAARA